MSPARITPGGAWIFVVVVLTVMVALVGCEKGTLGVQGGTVSGLVRDAKTLAGLAGVTVTAEAGTGETKTSRVTSTDNQGGFWLSDLRPGEWTFGFDKVGYAPITTAGSGTTNQVVVVNSEHRVLQEVRMDPNFYSRYIMVRGTLKDAVTGLPITLGVANYAFETTSFNNRLPTEFQTGFSIPAANGPISARIAVTNYQTASGTIPDGRTDYDFGVVYMTPQTYSIVGAWQDVPGWVYTKAPTARVFAYAGNRLISQADVPMNTASFRLNNIPVGQEVSIRAEIPGYRMNGPILVNPNSDFAGTIYQTISLKSNFSPILRDVTVVVIGGAAILGGQRVGAYCAETGTRWPETILTNPPGSTGVARVVTLGTLQMPTGYSFQFVGYNVDTGSRGEVGATINDDGVDAQIVTIPVS